MSYYENRIKALEERVAEMARDQRMKAIPVEAKLVESIAKLQAENKRLIRAGDAMAFNYEQMHNIDGVYDSDLMKFVARWNAAKEGKPSV